MTQCVMQGVGHIRNLAYIFVMPHSIKAERILVQWEHLSLGVMIIQIKKQQRGREEYLDRCTVIIGKHIHTLVHQLPRPD